MGVCIEKICRRETAERIKERKMLHKLASEKIKYSKLYNIIYKVNSPDLFILCWFAYGVCI